LLFYNFKAKNQWMLEWENIMNYESWIRNYG